MNPDEGTVSPSTRLGNAAQRASIGSFIALGLLALSAGSGELYGWPRLASLEGSRVFWLLIPCTLLQIPVLAECQRVALLTGRSLFAPLAEFSRVGSWLGAILMLVSFFWLGGWLSGSAAMIAILLGVPSQQLPFATNVLSVVLAIGLGWPLWTKRFVVRYVSFVLKLFSLATFLAAFLALLLIPNKAQTLTQYLGEMFTPHPDVFSHLLGADTTDLILAITFLGMGSWASVLYSGYASFENYGRKEANRIWLPPKRSESDSTPGCSHLLSEAESELRPWYRHLYIDTSIGLLLNTLCTAVLAFLAVAVLYDSGQSVGNGYDLLSQQARFFDPLLGAAAKPVFILIGASFLLDTWLGFVPLMAKGVQEAIQPTSTWLQRFSEEAVYRAVLTLLAAQSVLTAMFAAPGTLLRATAFCLAVTHPIVILLLILVNYLYLPRRYGAFARPARSSFIAILVALISYTILAAWYAMTVLG